MYSSSDLERGGQFRNEDQPDDSWEEDPKTVGQDVEEDESVPVIVTCLAPAAAVVLHKPIHIFLSAISTSIMTEDRSNLH